MHGEEWDGAKGAMPEPRELFAGFDLPPLKWACEIFITNLISPNYRAFLLVRSRAVPGFRADVARRTQLCIWDVLSACDVGQAKLLGLAAPRVSFLITLQARTD